MESLTDRAPVSLPRTLYSWWSVVSAGLSLLWLFVALSYFAAPTFGIDELVFVVVLGLPAAWCTLRAPLMRVVLQPDVLVHHGLLRTRRYARRAIAEVSAADTGNITGSGQAPQLVLVTGRTVTLGCLSSYGEARTATRVLVLRRWLRRAPSSL